MNRYHILREPVLLFLVGVCLSISQFVMLRDFVTILYGEEVVIILVTAALTRSGKKQFQPGKIGILFMWVRS